MAMNNPRFGWTMYELGGIVPPRSLIVFENVV
jgi:hypothetical protein